ncbi:methylmalonyl-CoA epimerase [Halalkalibacter urbisdiaboli]|uniref:methylmalonyl-CoA epimerase n=1 Tax=Halalkalibacter urbisdiaboli TaxID=1960589 RepID=UPI000B434F31|nr:methylmalonyl-CoA epimerase [Halalkalibacter urbisdiaboli]
MKDNISQKVDHIGIAVTSINKVLPFYIGSLKLSLEKIEEVPTQEVRVAFLSIGDVKIELLEPLSNTSPIARFIRKRGEGLHHIAIGVTSIETRINDMIENGVQMINKEPIQGADDALIAFLHPKSTAGVLYELCEKQK